MNKISVEEFVSEVKIRDKLKVVSANSPANYSFLFKYRRCPPNDSRIFFIDDEMNIIVIENNQSIYDKVYIENVRNLLSKVTIKAKCDEFNNILMGTHKAILYRDKINYENRPNGKVDYHVISTNVFGSKRISTKLAQLTQKIRNQIFF